MENPQANGTVDGQTKDAELAEELQEGAKPRRKHIVSSGQGVGHKIRSVKHGERM
jgi:hypothetical protein